MVSIAASPVQPSGGSSLCASSSLPPGHALGAVVRHGYPRGHAPATCPSVAAVPRVRLARPSGTLHLEEGARSGGTAMSGTRTWDPAVGLLLPALDDLVIFMLYLFVLLADSLTLSCILVDGIRGNMTAQSLRCAAVPSGSGWRAPSGSLHEAQR